jgi:hypothetical protein
MVTDWSPDGSQLAVAHEVNGVVRLEYPIGNVLYESEGWISDLRVNADGQRVLIADNPARGDNFAIPRIVHTDGGVTTVAPTGASWGLLWGPDGESVWMASGTGLLRVRPGEEPELMIDLPTSIRPLDFTSSGRLLAFTANVRREMVVRAPGSDEERELSWLDWTTPAYMSHDGRFAVFEEGNLIQDGAYGVFLRRTDGTPPVQLGYGSTVALSPDNDWLAMVERPFAEDSELALVPTGPGTQRHVDTGGIRIPPNAGAWVPDASGPGALVVTGRERNGPLRLYWIPLDGSGASRAITPADFGLAPNGHVVSLDGRRVFARPASGLAMEFDIGGEGPTPVPGLLASDLPIAMDRDGQHLYVQATRNVPSRIDRVDTLTGERERWLELSPLDPAGVFTVDRLFMSADGKAYCYSIRRIISRLVVVDGLQ